MASIDRSNHSPKVPDAPSTNSVVALLPIRGEKIYDRKNANRCSPFGRDPGRGNAWEPNRRI